MAHSGGMTTYTDQEQHTLRAAAFGSIYMVSKADPGFFDMVKESFAGSKAFGKASPELRQVLVGGGMPTMPKGSPQEIENSVISALSQSTSILAAKGGNELDEFRNAVSHAVDEVASASGGTSPKEFEVVGKVKAALGM